MATEQREYCDGSNTASADLRTHQYKFVKISGAGTVTVCAASTDKPLGVLQNKPNTGEVADIMITGRSKLVAGAAVSAGADLMSDASGRGLTAVSASNQQYGRAATAAAGANEIIEAFLPGVARTI